MNTTLPNLSRLTITVGEPCEDRAASGDKTECVHTLSGNVDEIEDTTATDVKFELISKDQATSTQTEAIRAFLETVHVDTGSTSGPDTYLKLIADKALQSTNTVFISLATRDGDLVGVCILMAYFRTRRHVNYSEEETTETPTTSSSTQVRKRPRGIPVYKVMIIAVHQDYRRVKICGAGVGTRLWSLMYGALTQLGEECQVQVGGPVCLNQPSSRNFWTANGFKVQSLATDEELTATLKVKPKIYCL